MKHDALLQDITEFLRENGMSAYRFGLLAARNGRLVERLSRGGRVWPETEQAVRDFMAQRNNMAANSVDLPPSRRSV